MIFAIGQEIKSLALLIWLTFQPCWQAQFLLQCLNRCTIPLTNSLHCCTKQPPTCFVIIMCLNIGLVRRYWLPWPCQQLTGTWQAILIVPLPTHSCSAVDVTHCMDCSSPISRWVDGWVGHFQPTPQQLKQNSNKGSQEAWTHFSNLLISFPLPQHFTRQSSWTVQ